MEPGTNVDPMEIDHLDVICPSEDFNVAVGPSIHRFPRREVIPVLVRVIASLMAAIASVVESLLSTVTGTDVWSNNSNLHRYHIARQELYHHLIPTFLHLVGIVYVQPREIIDEWYIKPRTFHCLMLWMDDSPREDPQRFREFFRVGPDLFFYICELLHDEMLMDPPESLRILPNRKLLVTRQVALALRRLAVGDTFLTLGELFGVSKSTAIKVTWKFICALRIRGGHVICWPDATRLAEIKSGFATRWGFPNCCGAIDGTHLPIELPVGEDSTQYYDWKHKLSVSMQAICDHRMRFLDVFCGLPGSIQDTRLMRLSHFYAQVTQHQSRLNGPRFHTSNNTDVQEYILGDVGYPLLPWLIVPYPKGLSQHTEEFNYMHSSTRMCVERSFGKLKGTWRILNRILWKPQINRVGPMIFACCILHNLIIDRNDALPNVVWSNVPPHPTGYAGVGRPNLRMYRRGPEARDALRHHLLD